MLHLQMQTRHAVCGMQTLACRAYPRPSLPHCHLSQLRSLRCHLQTIKASALRPQQPQQAARNRAQRGAAGGLQHDLAAWTPHWLQQQRTTVQHLRLRVRNPQRQRAQSQTRLRTPDVAHGGQMALREKVHTARAQKTGQLCLRACQRPWRR
jgi:hypothetical protein